VCWSWVPTGHQRLYKFSKWLRRQARLLVPEEDSNRLILPTKPLTAEGTAPTSVVRRKRRGSFGKFGGLASVSEGIATVSC
jgi:hypothetical protein